MEPNMEPVRQFRDWLATAPAHDRFIYHIGLLAADRFRVYDDGERFLLTPLQPADSMGNLAWAAYEEGRVELVQKRQMDGRFYYAAIKRKHRRHQNV
jgi:hypothetical protein